MKRRVTVEIDLKALVRNYRKIAAHVKPAKVLCVLKANAYGLGVADYAKALASAGCTLFGVAEPFEALELQKALKSHVSGLKSSAKDAGRKAKDVKHEIQILSSILPDEIDEMVRAGVILPIVDVATAKLISAAAVKAKTVAKVHFKLDTGMGRLGILAKDALAVMQEVEKLPNLDCEGVFSHFPMAYDPKDPFTKRQIALFKRIVADAGKFGITFKKVHIAASDGINNFPECAKKPFTVVRTGINLHGSFDPYGKKALKVEPVLTLKTRVAQVRELPAGTTLGYGRTWCLNAPTKVATVSAGYADGLPLALTNRGFVFIGGRRCRIVGRISMDYTTVDVSEVPDVKPGDEVVCFGRCGKDSITPDDWAALKGTHAYDIICSLGNRVQRIAVKGVLLACCLAGALFATAAEDSAALIGNVRLKGHLGDRLDAMIARHVGGTDADYITAPFLEKTERNRRWQTEFWGKWMHSAMPYLKYTGSAALKASVDRGIARMLASQEPNGYIGNYPDELRCGEGWDVWGMKYTMMGLLHYYDGTKDAKVLDACRRLCDYVIAELGPNGRRGYELWTSGNWSGYASSSILEPVMWLYKRTEDRRYLDFAAYVVKGMTEPEAGPRLLDLALKGVSVADRNGIGQKNHPEDEWQYVCKYGRDKAYEMMSCYQGLLEYAEVTGRKDLVDAALATANDIVKEEVNLAGGCACSEAWFHGARKQHLPYLRLQETCVTTTWMRFCEKLLDLTGDPKWADQIERTFYNAYLGAMKADGSEFSGYTPLTGNRYHGQHHCFMHTDCCTANGPRGFLCFLKQFFRAKDDGAVFNFYSSALVSDVLPASGRKIAFDVYSLYPRKELVRIVSHTENAGKVPVRFRIPAWSAKTSVTLNGKALPGVTAGAYYTLAHEWRLGDVVEIRFSLPVVAHVNDHHVAFTRGPVLLARDSRFADGDLTEPLRHGISDGQVMPTFAAVRSPSDDMWMAFSATLPIGCHHANPEGALPETVFFCDYASAGNTWRRDDYYRTWFPVEINRRDR